MQLAVAQLRLHNQQLAFPRFTTADQVVEWFGAMQAQDFAAAKWAIAMRTSGLTDADVERVFNEGKILRTHIMRPTWHFVAPSDVRWLLALTSPRVKRFNGYYYRQTGLDKTIFEKSNDVIREALTGGQQLTREELDSELKKHKIPTENLGLSYTIMQAELDGIICSGPRKGRQFTYMLLEERVPKTKDISQDEALAELVKRYFQSHGPAQIADFVWWSGLTVADAKKGMEIVGSCLQRFEKEGKVYWYVESMSGREEMGEKDKKEERRETAYLIPGFDEYFIAYKDRSDILDKGYAKHLNQGGGMINGAIVVNGRMVGGWKRTFEKKSVVIRLQLFEKISASQKEALVKQAESYSRFINLPLVLQV